MNEDPDEVEVLEIDRIAANKFIQAQIAHKYELARPNSELEHSLREEAKALSEYLLKADNRTACILAVSFLEDAIKRNFIDKWAITPNLTDQFFGPNGPLSTIFQRVTVAQGLGWIPEKAIADMATLRKLRNQFAHNHRVHSFTEEPLLSWANELSPIEQIWNVEGATHYQKAYREASLELRLRTRVACCVFLGVSKLIARSNLIKFELEPSYRAGGFEGLTEIEKDFIDIIASHCFASLGIESSGLG